MLFREAGWCESQAVVAGKTEAIFASADVHQLFLRRYKNGDVTFQLQTSFLALKGIFKISNLKVKEIKPFFLWNFANGKSDIILALCISHNQWLL